MPLDSAALAGGGNGGHAALTGGFSTSRLHGSNAAEGRKRIDGVAQLEKAMALEKSLCTMLEHPAPVPASVSTLLAGGCALGPFWSLFPWVSPLPSSPLLPPHS